MGRYIRRTAEVYFALPATPLSSSLQVALAQSRKILHAALTDKGLMGRARSVFHQITVSAGIHASDQVAWLPNEQALYVERMHAFLPELLFQMSVAGLISPQGISWSQSVQSLSFPQARKVLVLKENNGGVTFYSGRIEAMGHGAAFSLNKEGMDNPPEWISFHPSFTPVTGRGLLSTHDSNLLSDFEAHPDKEGNFVNLSDRPESEWVSSLQEALGRVAKGLPHLRQEMDLLMQQWIPVGFEPEMHLSASYQEAIGQAYLTLHPNNYTMMEAMVHEFQHNKVNALMHIDPLLENAFSPLFSSPVRPDPRPLHGVLLAVHAFIPVAELYRQLRALGVPELSQPDLMKRLKQIVKGNHEGMEVLREHGQWTDIGARFFAQLDALDTRHFSEELS